MNMLRVTPIASPGFTRSVKPPLKSQECETPTKSQRKAKIDAITKNRAILTENLLELVVVVYVISR